MTPSLTGPRPVRCLTGQRRRDVAVARDAVAGRFTHAGITLALGRRPDWLYGGLADDEEWRIEWVKLYEGLDLAHAYAATADPEFLHAWEDLVDSFCEQVPVDHDSTDVSARRLQNWLYAWQSFAETPAYDGLRPGLAERLLRRIDTDARHIAGHLTAERNHRTLELYSLLLAGLALGDDGRAEQSLAALADNASTDVWDDGVHRECSSDYHMIVLRSFVRAIANARAAGLDVPPNLLERVHRGCDVALHLQRPDGRTPALSDGDPADFRDLLEVAGDLLDRPDLAWAGTMGDRGTPPADRSVGFPVGGYYVQRSGWGDRGRAYSDELFGVFDCGPLGDGGHGHYDQLSVELYGAGGPFVVDPGRYTYASDGSGWRHWFKGTAGHNTVCVDGLDQTPYQPGKPKGPVSSAYLLGRCRATGVEVLRGQVHSPAYDAVHTRTIAFVRDDYWIVHDRLRAPGPHRYVARWHLAAAAQGATTACRDATQDIVRTPAGVLVVPAGHGLASLEDGWVSPEYGVKLPAPILAVEAAGHADADLITVLLPGGGYADVIAACDEGHVEVRVWRPDGVDTVRWTAGGSALEARWSGC